MIIKEQDLMKFKYFFLYKMHTIWWISMSIILLTVLVLFYIRINEINIENDYKYLASAIGLSGFIFAVMGDGIFVNF
jgi:hypothetical protein